MLPSSHRRKKNNHEHNDAMTLGDIERYYKKPNAVATRGAIGARDNSKIKGEKTKQILDDDDEDGDLNELEPTYIESYISETFSSAHIEEEEEYENKYNNGLSIKTHKMTNIKYPFADKSSKHLTRDLDNIGDASDINGGEILV